MDKISNGVATLLVIALLIVGGLFTYVIFPRTVELKPDKCEAVPCKAVDCIPTEVEVIKEVPQDIKATYLDTAIVDFENSDKFEDLECSGIEDIDQIVIKKVYNIWSVSFDEDETQVDFSVRLKYLDKDTKEKCYQDCDVSVLYEKGDENLDKKPELNVECE